MNSGMLAAVSGLKAHQTKMDVIGNNIANVNTVGFKSATVNFKDVFSQTIKNATAAGSSLGGTNPMQVGLGMSVSAIDNIQTVGSLERTDNPSDLAISGQGFFIVKENNGQNYKFTRAGNFTIDKLGNLVTSDGMNVYGWMDTKANDPSSFDTDADIKPINIYTGKQTMSAKETTKGTLEGNLNAGTKSAQELKPGTAAKPAVATTTFALSGNIDSTSTALADPIILTVGSASKADIGNAIDDTASTPSAPATRITIPYTVYDATGNKTTGNIVLAKYQDGPAGATDWLCYDAGDANDPPAQALLTFDASGATTDSLVLSNGLTVDMSSLKIGTGSTTAQAVTNGSAAVPASMSGVITPGGLTMDDIHNAVENVDGLDSYIVPYTSYDKLGNATTVDVVFIKNQTKEADPSTTPATPAQTEWVWYALSADQKTGVSNYYYNHSTPEPATKKTPEVAPTFTPDQGTVTFDENGKVMGVTPISAKSTDSKYGVDIAGIPSKDGTTYNSVVIDFANITQFQGEDSVQASSVDGYPAGKMTSYTIDSNGIITGTYSNGQQQPLAMLGLTSFQNAQGLEKVGSNMYEESNNSGNFTKAMQPGTGSVGTLSSGVLEMSNVDLSKEFTDMITTQRGFQANSKIISTTDEMLQDLVNLKR